MEDYTDPINLTYIFCNEGDDPLYKWVKVVGELVLDKAGG